MRKLKFKDRVKRRFGIDDDRIISLEELVVDILQRLDELPTPKKSRKKK